MERLNDNNNNGLTSEQTQQRLLNRVSGFFFNKRRPDEDEDENEGPSSTSHLSHRAISSDPMIEDDRATTASRVDSMFSSFQSQQSNRPNPNTPPPLRTVELDNTIVHKSDTPPSPPSSSSSPLPSSSSSSSRKNATSPGDDVDAAFEKLLQEYALPANLKPSLSQLSREQKAVLLQSSQSRMLLRKNSSFSTKSFSLAATLGIHKKGRNSLNKLFTPPASSEDSLASYASSPSMKKPPGTSGRSGHRPRTSLLSGGGSYGESSSSSAHGGRTMRSKLKSSPEYFVHLLSETPVRQLEEADILDLRVFLRNVVVSWTTEFLAKGGYEVISDLFRQMKEIPKRYMLLPPTLNFFFFNSDRFNSDLHHCRMPNDDKMLQHLAKCFKAIMTHEAAGIEKVLTEPSALEHIRDLLFGPGNQKQKAIYGLEVTTRSLLLNLLCTLASLQTKRTSTTRYVHGYDVLRNLLLDRPHDTPSDESANKELPFRMSLKTDTKAVMRMILENEAAAEAAADENLQPRYTAWMREIQYTVDRHIEPITFLAQVLDYKFESAFRQLKLKPQDKKPEDEAPKSPDDPNQDASGSVMVDEGVVDYLITHLRLICTIITTPATTYQGIYDEREQEKVRLEIMLSGFDKISKALRGCPHPTLYASYIRYLQPLLKPWADLSVPSVSATTASSSSSLHPPPRHHKSNHSSPDPSTSRNPYETDKLSNASAKNAMHRTSFLGDADSCFDTPFLDEEEDPDLYPGSIADDPMWIDEDDDLASLDNYDDIFDEDEEIVYYEDEEEPPNLDREYKWKAAVR
ncbi:armadillo-type protein [Radiomyces spectabilis]|uniref:armadillo-type protein n=1 Tax=Radiomyces spectabilis TaxID=64574 RepID=UPI00221E48C4|nr:armadillo-type protein [Radiomyces spectabilis]KAI8372922.1 armadillo-type protein [Radiomyces spectabilis]